MEKIKNTPNNNRNYLLGVVVLIILAAIVGWSFLSSNRSSNNSSNNKDSQTNTSESTKSATENTSGDTSIKTKYDEKKTPHFVSSTPDNNSVLKTAPQEVAISFDFNLGTGSNIKVSSDKGADVVPSGPKISSDMKTLSVPVSITKDGNYAVDYTACWPDGSCHNGTFGFTVKSK